jgi:hypothetical protein
MTDVVTEPPNTISRVDRLWMFISQDDAGNEGLCAATLMPGFGLVPLIAADETRLKSLMPVAERLARTTSRKIVLIELSQRSDVRTIVAGN